MKSRNIALYLSLFAFAGVVYWWTRVPNPVLPEAVEPGTGATEVRDPSKIIEVEKPHSDVNSLPSLDSNSAQKESTTPVSSGGFSGPVPFGSIAMSELEEVSLANSAEQHSHKIREWRGRIEPSLPEIKDLLEAEGEEGVLAISLPDASLVKVTGMRFESFGSNQGVITGKILGDAFGEVVLSYVNQAVAGSIRDYRNDMVWEVRNAGEGRQYIAQVDVDALGECGVCKESSNN